MDAAVGGIRREQEGAREKRGEGREGKESTFYNQKAGRKFYMLGICSGKTRRAIRERGNECR